MSVFTNFGMNPLKGGIIEFQVYDSSMSYVSKVDLRNVLLYKYFATTPKYG